MEASPPLKLMEYSSWLDRSLIFKLEARTGTGKGAARQARRDGMVPGIVLWRRRRAFARSTFPFNKLAENAESWPLSVSTLFNLKVEGQDDVRVICRDVQRHVVKDLPTHVDLHAPAAARHNNRLSSSHVEFINEDECTRHQKSAVVYCPLCALKSSLSCLAGDIPDAFTVDLDRSRQLATPFTISSMQRCQKAQKPTVRP